MAAPGWVGRVTTSCHPSRQRINTLVRRGRWVDEECTHTAQFISFTVGQHVPTQKLHFPWSDLNPHRMVSLVHTSLSPKSKRHLDRFSRFCTSQPCVHACSRSHLGTACWQCGLMLEFHGSSFLVYESCSIFVAVLADARFPRVMLTTSSRGYVTRMLRGNCSRGISA